LKIAQIDTNLNERYEKRTALWTIVCALKVVLNFFRAITIQLFSAQYNYKFYIYFTTKNLRK